MSALMMATSLECLRCRSLFASSDEGAFFEDGPYTIFLCSPCVRQLEAPAGDLCRYEPEAEELPAWSSEPAGATSVHPLRGPGE